MDIKWALKYLTFSANTFAEKLSPLFILFLFVVKDFTIFSQYLLP
jgi:hypothetical protein